MRQIQPKTLMGHLQLAIDRLKNDEPVGVAIVLVDDDNVYIASTMEHRPYTILGGMDVLKSHIELCLLGENDAD